MVNSVELRGTIDNLMQKTKCHINLGCYNWIWLLFHISSSNDHPNDDRRRYNSWNSSLRNFSAACYFPFL